MASHNSDSLCLPGLSAGFERSESVNVYGYLNVNGGGMTEGMQY